MSKVKEKAKQAYIKVNENRQRTLTLLTYILTILMAILTSALQMIFDTENFDSRRFITNLCFNLAFSILGLFIAMKDGKVSNETKPSGAYYELKEKFKKTLNLVVDREIFRQFCDILYNRERKAYAYDMISEVDVTKEDYLLISNEDFEYIKDKPKKCVVGVDAEGNEIIKPLDTLSEKQWFTVKKYRDGNFKFPKLKFSYFTSKNGLNGYKQEAEREENKQRLKMLMVGYRIILVTTTSVIFALCIVNPTKSTGAQVAFDLFSRLSNFVVSVTMGYMLAHDEMVSNMSSLEYKIDVINQFSYERETGKFIPVDVEKELLEKIEKLEEEERKRYVDVEIVDSPSEMGMLGSSKDNEENQEPQEKEVILEITQEEYNKIKEIA